MPGEDIPYSKGLDGCLSKRQTRGEITELMCVYFIAIHEILTDDLANGLADHSPQRCIVCTPEAASSEDEVTTIILGWRFFQALPRTHRICPFTPCDKAIPLHHFEIHFVIYY